MTADPKPPPAAYRVPDACRELSIGRTLLYDLIRDGKLRPVHIRGRTLIPRAEIERLLTENVTGKAA